MTLFRKLNFVILVLLTFLFTTAGSEIRAATVDCQADRTGDGLVLYLYYPTVSDSDFPSPMFGEVTSPIAPFDADDLDPDLGSTAEYRNAITERVRTDYCEFDVRVVQTTSSNGTTNPVPTDDNYYVVGIGSDSGGGFFGVCCNSRMARVFAGTFANGAVAGGSFDGLLTPGDGTIDRWANAIAGTTSHEPGHSSILGNPGHGAAAPRPGEDALENHIMDTPPAADRIEDRHFSDTSYEALAGALGLYEQTLSNWDFINPNSSTADGLQITVLIDQDADTPQIGSVYDGGLSPWSNAQITAAGTTTFQNDTYDRYTITFTDAQGWNNGDSGEIPAGEEFHVGVGLTENYIVNDVTLLADDSPMQLHPRVVGYTPDGSFNPETGDFHLTVSVPDPENGPMLVSDVRVRHLPRTLSINEMTSTGILLGVDGRPVMPWQDRDGVDVSVASAAELPVANLAEQRAVDFFRTADPECGMLPEAPPVPDHLFLDLPYCEEGPVLGLFPSTRVYVEATITDPNATYFDRSTGTMVTGPLSNRIFIQFSGKIPDLNGNGVDDAIDIDTGTCSDDNDNGVCDEAEPTRYRYAAKFVCGNQPKTPSDGRLVRGHYATTVNILNVSDDSARIKKFLSLSFPPEEQVQGAVLPITVDRLDAGHALKTDCADVERRLFPDGFPTTYIEGYIAIETANRLDVTGVYTSRDTIEAPACHQNEAYPNCKRACDDRPQNGCPGAPALSTTLEVVPAKEYIIEAQAPVEMCADLTVSEIGLPRVSCPEGAGSCVTELVYQLANIGNAASGPFQSRAVLDPTQSVVVDSSIPNLLPGATTSVQIRTPAGGNCFDPDCTTNIAADFSDRVMECREDNNTGTRTTQG